MTPEQLDAKLTELLALPAETEWVEFKEAKNSFGIDDIGEYFSQARTLHRSAREAAIIISIHYRNPTFSLLTSDIGKACLTLSI